MFIDDILVYSPTLLDHLLYLKEFLAILQRHQLYVNWGKCYFGQAKLEYLGHLISYEGIMADPTKIRAMEEWLT